MDASPIERLRIEREKSIILLKENGYWSEDSTLVTTSNTAEQILSTSLDLLEELKWSPLQMSLESVPAAEAGPSVAGPSVAEALADFALMAMESLPVAEAGPSVAELLDDPNHGAVGVRAAQWTPRRLAPRLLTHWPGWGAQAGACAIHCAAEAGHSHVVERLLARVLAD